MKNRIRHSIVTGLFITILTACNNSPSKVTPIPVAQVIEPTPELPGEAYISESFEIHSAQVKYEPVLDSYLFTIETNADAASITPTPAGKVDGAPVLGYIFITDLLPADIGYTNVAGTVALAVTSHPDFDDTPLWDEDNNQQYDDDGIVYHSHWVLLEENKLATAGLAVVQASNSDVLTPTSPMAMYLDSPGYTILEKGDKLHVIVPVNAVKRKTNFTSKALTAYLEVDASGNGPLLKVERIYDQFPTELTVVNKAMVVSSNWPSLTTQADNSSFMINGAAVDYLEEIDSLIFSVHTEGNAATKTVNKRGQVDGAPVVGYVFPTTIEPKNVGFKNIAEATLALAVTTHPDFDDTPLWDENNNGNYQDDGIIYHTHWVALVNDDKSAAGISVPTSLDKSNLPPTAPMSMYLDSPDFHAFAQGNLLRIIVPVQRINGITDFKFNSLTARMNVDLSDGHPVLRVNEVFDTLSGNLSLQYSVTPKQLNDY
ncbi:MAG: hypothetical protein ACI9LM_002167 [Alteromonadaceae bacterium]|jgi:hypothetical protein